MADLVDAGIVQARSRFSVAETVERLMATLEAKGITLFALIDHSGEAAKVGMRLPETKLLVFGSPRAGTPVMLAAPTSALDLPLKVLVRELGGSGGEERWSTTARDGWRLGMGCRGSLWGCWGGWRGCGGGGWVVMVGFWGAVAGWKKAIQSLRLRLRSGLRQSGTHSCAMRPAHEWGTHVVCFNRWVGHSPSSAITIPEREPGLGPYRSFLP